MPEMTSYPEKETVSEQPDRKLVKILIEFHFSMLRSMNQMMRKTALW